MYLYCCVISVANYLTLTLILRSFDVAEQLPRHTGDVAFGRVNGNGHPSMRLHVSASLSQLSFFPIIRSLTNNSPHLTSLDLRFSTTGSLTTLSDQNQTPKTPLST
jgi:hypothetical protein